MVNNLHLEPKFMCFLLLTFQLCLTKFRCEWLSFRVYHETNLESQTWWITSVFSYPQWRKPHCYVYSMLGFHLIWNLHKELCYLKFSKPLSFSIFYLIFVHWSINVLVIFSRMSILNIYSPSLCLEGWLCKFKLVNSGSLALLFLVAFHQWRLLVGEAE